MPYIKKKDRQEIKEVVLNREPYSFGYMLKNPGEVNYVISSILNGYIEKKGISYSTFNEIMGILECIKQEIYRRQISPYEDKKINENGDIFTIGEG